MTAPSIDALVSSRICHDLISPVGAIGNGIELMAELASTMPEVALISDSVDSAKTKLQFFRICFGQCANGADVSARVVVATSSAMLEGKRVTLKWTDLAQSSPRAEVKLLFLLLLCVETALPVGGDITVSRDEYIWTITAHSPRIQADDVWKTLEWQLPQEPFGPGQVQFPLARDLARDLGRTLEIAISDTVLKISL